MSAELGDWLARLVATDTPLLPSPEAMQLWRSLGWSVVLAWLGGSAVGRWWPGKASGWLRPWTAVLVLALALWAWAPGAYSTAYWLALVFQAPSGVTVLLCAGLLVERRGSTRPPAAAVDGAGLALASLAVLLGWALLLDTFALLPVQLYARGFSPLVAGLVVAAALLPWVLAQRPLRATDWRMGVVPLAVLMLVVWRLPSGNAWDAVLDPCLWLVLHGVLLARIRSYFYS